MSASPPPWERYWLDPESTQIHRDDELRARRVEVWLPILPEADRTPWDRVSLYEHIVSRKPRRVIVYATSARQAEKAWTALQSVSIPPSR